MVLTTDNGGNQIIGIFVIVLFNYLGTRVWDKYKDRN